MKLIYCTTSEARNHSVGAHKVNSVHLYVAFFTGRNVLLLIKVTSWMMIRTLHHQAENILITHLQSNFFINIKAVSQL